jgi:hypothetical protein
MTPVPKLLRPALAACAVALLSAACSKRSDEAPAESAASQAPSPAAAPEDPAAPEPARPPPALAPGAGGPSSLKKGEDKPRRDELAREDDDAFTRIDDAERAFADSKKELDTLLGPLPADKVAGAQPPAPLAAGDTRCPRACKAFDSLRRSGDAICRLAGDADARCTRARDVMKQNATRVAACGCQGSEAPR